MNKQPSSYDELVEKNYKNVNKIIKKKEHPDPHMVVMCTLLCTFIIYLFIIGNTRCDLSGRWTSSSSTDVYIINHHLNNNIKIQKINGDAKTGKVYKNNIHMSLSPNSIGMVKTHRTIFWIDEINNLIEKWSKI